MKAEIIWYCSWCKSKINGYPKRFDYMKYLGPGHSYNCEYHFNFCDTCLKKISGFIKENHIKGVKVNKKAYWRQ